MEFCYPTENLCILYLLDVELLHGPVLSGPFLINEKKLSETRPNRQEPQRLEVDLSIVSDTYSPLSSAPPR